MKKLTKLKKSKLSLKVKGSTVKIKLKKKWKNSEIKIKCPTVVVSVASIESWW